MSALEWADIPVPIAPGADQEIQLGSGRYQLELEGQFPRARLR